MIEDAQKKRDGQKEHISILNIQAPGRPLISRSPGCLNGKLTALYSPCAFRRTTTRESLRHTGRMPFGCPVRGENGAFEFNIYQLSS